VAFFLARRANEALKSLNILLDNAIVMNRFDDVSFILYRWSLGMSSIAENSNDLV
jgi:hypothetical protein